METLMAVLKRFWPCALFFFLFARIKFHDFFEIVKFSKNKAGAELLNRIMATIGRTFEDFKYRKKFL